MNNRHDRVLHHVLLCWIFTICSRIFTWCVTLLCIYEMQIMLPISVGKLVLNGVVTALDTGVFQRCSQIVNWRYLDVMFTTFFSTSGLQCWCNINSTRWFIIRFIAHPTIGQVGRRHGKWSILALNVDLMSSHNHFVTNRYFHDCKFTPTSIQRQTLAFNPTWPRQSHWYFS